MTFDINALLQDPAFIYGSTLMGAKTGNPYVTAQKALQDMQEAQAMQQYRQLLCEQARHYALMVQQKLDID